MSYIDSSRGFHIRGRCKDVYDSGTGDCVWDGCKRGVWGCILGNDIVIKTKAGFIKPAFVYCLVIEMK